VFVSRRQFVIQSALASAALLHPPSVFSAPSDRVGVGVIGLGRRGRRHVDEFERLPGVDVVALCDVAPAPWVRSESRRNRWTMTSEYRRLLDDRSIDLVSIATPAEGRASIVAEAVAAGKAVLVEAPCCTSLEESRRLGEVLRRAERVAQQVTHRSFSATQDFDHLLGRSLVTSARVSSTSRSDESGLCGGAVEELDFARTVLGVGLPDAVTAVGVYDVRTRRYSRMTARFEFRDRAKPKIVELDLTSSQSGEGASLVTLAGDGRRFEAMGRLVSPQDPELNSWANVVHTLRQGKDSLRSPISELRLASSMAFLAQRSLEQGRSILVDPIAESVLSC
jgi:predicted dehydrogenase